MNQTKMTQKAILQSDKKVATHTSDREKRKVTDTINGNLQQHLFSNQTLPIISMAIDPWIPDGVEACGGTPNALTLSTKKAVITDAVRISAHILWTPGHVSRMGKDGVTPRERYVVVRSPGITGQL